MEVSLLSHLTNSALVVYALKWLRGTDRYQRFAAWLPMADGKVHVLMSAIGALMTAVGMHGAFKGSVGDGWTVTLMIPPLWVVLHAAWDGAQQLALNQIVFAIAVQEKTAAPVVTVPISRNMPQIPVTVTSPLEHTGA